MAKSAFKQVWKSVTGTPAVDFKDKRYTFVNYNSDGDIVTASAAGPVIGVLEEPNNVGQPAQVVASGFMFIILGAALTAGTEVASDATGRAVAAVDGEGAVGILAVGGAVNGIGTILFK